MLEGIIKGVSSLGILADNRLAVFMSECTVSRFDNGLFTSGRENSAARGVCSLGSSDNRRNAYAGTLNDRSAKAGRPGIVALPYQ